jgi:hypothetical protein
MSIGVSNNILAMYQDIEQTRKNESSLKNSCAPVKKEDNEATIPKKQKIGVGVCTALGVAASLMLLAKLDKRRNYSINPLKIFKGKIKNSYLAEANYKTKEIVTIGTGSILGGITGGTIFGDKKDFNSKVREGIVQIMNISFPIAFVQALSAGGNKLTELTMPNWCKSKNLLKQSVTKLPATAGAMVGLISGMVLGNKLSNKLNEKLFHKKMTDLLNGKTFQLTLMT